MTEPSRGRPPPPDRKEQLDDVVAEYLESIDSGAPPDLENLLKRHPDLAEELKAFFASDRQLHQLALRLSPAISAAPAPRRGERFGDYEIEGEIARGGMGVVYRARQVSLKRLVAVKMILAGRLASDEEVRRFQREAEAAARLDHPNIVPIYEIGDHQGQRFFSMKLVEGGSLAESIERHSRDGRAAAQLIETVARAVHYAHLRGILHRDLKPANILLDSGGQPHVTDFGLAKAQDGDRSLTQTGALVGTPSYMSPEHVDGKRGKFGPASDVYSLGVILYELLAGRPPFKEESSIDTLRAILEKEPGRPSLLNPRVPRDVETICLKCLAKEPGRRYASAGALADDLQRFLAGRPIEARRTSAVERTWRWCRRNPALSSLTAAVATLLMVLTAVSVTSAWRLRQGLREAYFERARAGRSSGMVGRRFESLKALREAARIRPSIEERNEAIGCLALIDLLLLQKVELPLKPGLRPALALHPDMTRYAVWDREGKVSIRRIEGGKEESSIGPPLRGVNAVEFSPDGRFLAAFLPNGGLSILNIEKSSEVLRESGVSYGEAVDFHPDGIEVAVGHEDGAISILPLAGGPPSGRAPLRGPGPVRSLQFRPDGRAVAISTTSSPQVRILDPHTGIVLQQISPTAADHAVATYAMAWHPAGNLLALGGDGEITLWDAATGEKKRDLSGHQASVIDVDFDPSGKYLASASYDGTSRLWHVPTGRQILQGPPSSRVRFGRKSPFQNDPAAALRAPRGGPRGSEAATTGPGPDARSRDEADGLSPPQPEGQVHLPNLVGSPGMHGQGGPARPGVHFEMGSEEMLLGSVLSGAEIRVSKVAESAVYRELQEAKVRSRRHLHIDISSDERMAVVAGYEGVSLWDLHRSERRAALPVGMVASAFFDPRGGALITWGAAGLHEWAIAVVSSDKDATRLAVGPPRSLGLRGTQPARGAISSDGQILALITEEFRNGVVFNRKEGRRQALLGGLPNFWSVAIRPDGRWVAGGTKPGKLVRIWDAQTGKVVRDLPVEATAKLAFSPDGTVLATCEPARYRLWDLESFAVRKEIPRNESRSNLPGHLAFSPDGKIAAVADSVRDMKLFDAATGESIAALNSPDPHLVTMTKFSSTGKRILVLSEDSTVQVWEIESLRNELGSLGLDWAPALSRPHSGAGLSPPVFVEKILLGDLSDPGTVSSPAEE